MTLQITLFLKDLEDFVKKGKDGFILFSMGSAIKGKYTMIQHYIACMPI